MPTIRELQDEAFQNAVNHGFWDDCKTGYGPDGSDDPSGPTIARIDREKVLAKIPEKVALLHSEISEMLEAYREYPGECAANDLVHTRRLDTDEPSVAQIPVDATQRLPRKPAGIREEAADTVIRLLDLCGALGIDLERAVVEKMAYNESRPYKHGKTC